MVIGRFQADISTVKLAANFNNMVKLPDGWPIGLPSGGEPGARTVGTEAQPQLQSDRTATTSHRHAHSHN
ncbi:hypothetical protein GCM10010251_71870 [Streptomyces aurantiogriseus]|uniref:Uncharacterized protein n=1 Tax=Streptomyces aurantiogriseus TaxID=66870 RepID=A0A918FJR1_9ACTN|nr:hypothetical protein GCM10010251_71870 [Streptomyces aurantiogriseus]